MIATVAVRPLRADDIPVLVGLLGRAYGSEQNFELRLRSYLQMHFVATFVAELDGVPVGMVVGNDYGRLAYVSQMAVDPALQRRGVGRQLMDALMAWVATRGFAATELDATPAGYRLYTSYGFVTTEQTDVYANLARGERLSTARPYLPAERSALFAVDASAFGADRSEVLALLIGAAPQAVVVVGEIGRIAGYAIAQVRTQLLGPVIAANADVAAELIDAARAQLPAGHRVNVPSSNPGVGAVLTTRGYRFLRSLAHMVRGVPPVACREHIFARINLGQG